MVDGTWKLNKQKYISNSLKMSSAVIYSNAFKLKTDIQQLCDSLLVPNSNTSIQEVKAKLDHLDRHIADLNDLGKREVTLQKKETIQGRVAQLRHDSTQCKTALREFKEREDARIAALQRESLLGQQSVTNRQRLQEESTILDLGGIREEQRLDAAGQNIDQYIKIGRGALQELYEQRDLLKSTQRRMLDAANKLGLSTTVIRFIEQRSMSDKYILWGGIFISLIIMYFVVKYFG